MNFICNNCVGARLYQRLGLPFDNPFAWCRIYPDDFNVLIRDYDKINFRNIKPIRKNNENDNTTLYGLEVDGKFKVYYPHYKHKDGQIEPEKVSVDIFVDDTDKYVRDMYLKRLERMKEKPIFVIAMHYCYGKKDYERICKTNSDKLSSIIIATDLDVNVPKDKLKAMITLKKGSLMTKKIATIILNTLHLRK